jgi:hypothetical protein
MNVRFKRVTAGDDRQAVVYYVIASLVGNGKTLNDIRKLAETLGVPKTGSYYPVEPASSSYIRGITAYSLALAGSLDAARARAAAIHRVHPHYGITDFLLAFHLEAEGAALFQRGAQCIGMA